MARRLNRDSYASPLVYFSEVEAFLSSPEFENLRENDADFSRSGPLSLRVMLTLILYMVADAGRRGYKPLLDAFWDECETLGIDLGTSDPVSAEAFCKARKKIPPPMILALLWHAGLEFDRNFGDRYRRKGHRILAVDGMNMQVQRSAELFDALGTHGGGHNPQMLVSTLYDVLSRVPHDVTIAPTHGSERAELDSMLDSLMPGDILVLDRGYPSFQLFSELRRRRVHLLVRLPMGLFGAVEEFVASGGTDGWITIHPTSSSTTHTPLRLRVVVHEREDAEPIVLITDLEEAEFDRAEIGDLYHLRWEEEEYYKLPKGDYVGQRQFHSKSLEGLKQEVFAFALFISIVRGLSAAAAVDADVPPKHIYQKTAILALADYLTRLLLEDRRQELARIMGRLIHRIGRTVVPPRPGRSHPRVSYRPRLRWTPSGKR